MMTLTNHGAPVPLVKDPRKEPPEWVIAAIADPHRQSLSEIRHGFALWQDGEIVETWYPKSLR